MSDSTRKQIYDTILLLSILWGITIISYWVGWYPLTFFSAIFSILFTIAGLVNIPLSIQDQKKLEKHIYVDEEFEHLGGYPYLKQNDIIKIQIHDDNLEIVSRYNNDRVIGKPIPISNVKDIQFKSEEEIQKDVTLTRLLTLGVFAFALPKQTTKNNQYLYLEYEQDNVNIKCLFKATANTKAGNLLSVFNKKKLESIQQQ
jgi:hypothetical protein